MNKGSMRMTSLYTKLYKFKEKCGRSRLEEFLTEAFCDLLNRIGEASPDEQRRMLHSLFQYEVHDAVLFSTQISVPGHGIRPDIVGFSKHGECAVPVMALELKIDAEFTVNSQTGEPQLLSYGKWLCGQNSKALLALVTAHTSPPDDFAGGSGAYGVECCRCVYWQDVYAALKGVADHPEYSVLLREFQAFLSEKGLASEAPTMRDFAQLGDYVTSGAAWRMHVFMNSLRDTLKAAAPAGLPLSWDTDKQYQWGGCIQPEAFSLNGWVRQPGSKAEPYIAWGIYYPPASSDEDPYGFHTVFGIERVAGAWVDIYFAQARPFPGKASQALQHQHADWHVPAEQGYVLHSSAVAFASLDSFAAGEEKMTSWFRARFEEACGYLAQC